MGGAVLGGATLVSIALNWFGRRRRKAAEKKRLKERKDALGSARVAVNSLYTKLEAELTGSFLAEARATRAPVTDSMLAQWLAVDGARRAVQDAADEVRAGAEELSSSVPLDQVVEQALQSITDQREGAPDATSVLLGENWLASDTEYEQTTTAETHELEEMGARDAERLRATITAFGSEADPQQLASWLDAVAELAEVSPAVDVLLAEAHRRQGSPPRIVFLGDYNTGKTSLLKRTLAEAGIATPPSLKVAARPTTSESTAYEWAGLHLVDSPGLQSLHADHQEAAKEASSGAALVVVLNVNLVVGDHSELRALLTGTDRTRPKARKALFVIGRSDELGVDPLGNPAQFLRLRNRKETELRQLLARWDVEIAAIHTVSADPYGTVGDDPVSGPDGFSAEFRTWDGIGAFTAALKRADEHADALVRLGVLDFTVDGLLGIAADLRDELTVLAEERTTEAATLGALRRGIDSGVVLASSLTAEAQAMARSHAERAAAEAMGATRDQLPDATEAAAHWWGDKEFQADAVSFYDRAAKEIAAWSADTDSELSRNLRWGDHSGGSRRRRRGARGTATAKAGVGIGRGANDVGRVMTNILKERNTLYTAAKKFTNIKFKPWGATKAAAKVAKVGAVLAVVGVVLDAASFAADVYSQGEREKARGRLADSIEQTLGRVETLLLRGSKRSPGPVAVLDTAVEGLRDQEAAAGRRVDTLKELMLSRQRLLGSIEELVSQQPLANGGDGSDD